MGPLCLCRNSAAKSWGEILMNTTVSRGGPRRGAGRKKGSYIGDAPRSARITITCTQEEADQIRSYAKAHGKCVTQCLLDLFRKASR